jgi:hypothetical protein
MLFVHTYSYKHKGFCLKLLNNYEGRGRFSSKLVTGFKMTLQEYKKALKQSSLEYFFGDYLNGSSICVYQKHLS